MAVSALATALLVSGPAWAALQNPAAPAVAPTQVETLSPYLPQTSCDPVAKPGTEALRTMLLQTYGGRDLGITRNCTIGATSEHKEGRAFDWGLNVSVPAEKAIADQFLTWLLDPGTDGVPAYNARRLGVMYVIWNGRIWGSYGNGWKPYTGAEAHTDHIHISLSWNGAMKTTSFWTGRAAPTDYGPCRLYVGLPVEKYSAPRTSPTCPPALAPMALTGTPVLGSGSTGPYVAQLQTLLGVAVDGILGPRSVTALTAWQSDHGLPATGTTDLQTWTALRTAVPPTAVTPAPISVLPAPVAVAGPVDVRFAPYAGLTLRTGATGPAVVALQHALHVAADGAFGAKTAAAVSAFSTAHGLRADGVVRPATWRALGAPATPVGKRAAGTRRWLPGS